MEEKINLPLIVLAVGLFATILALGGSPTSTNASQGATEHCPYEATKDENAPFTYTAEEDEIVTAVYVKAGTECTTLTASNSCYAVTGLGTKTATVTKIGAGSNCKDISYATFKVEEVQENGIGGGVILPPLTPPAIRPLVVAPTPLAAATTTLEGTGGATQALPAAGFEAWIIPLFGAAFLTSVIRARELVAKSS